MLGIDHMSLYFFSIDKALVNINLQLVDIDQKLVYIFFSIDQELVVVKYWPTDSINLVSIDQKLVDINLQLVSNDQSIICI